MKLKTITITGITKSLQNSQMRHGKIALYSTSTSGIINFYSILNYSLHFLPGLKTGKFSRHIYNREQDQVELKIDF